MPSLPNDIVEVNVKKVIPKTVELQNIFKEKIKYSSVTYSYSDLYKVLTNYVEDKDYVEYDTIYKVPIRKNIGSSTYVIESVLSDNINDNLEEFITLKLRNDLQDSSLNNKLTYKLFDETIEKSLKVGDELINYDGSGKVVITEIRQASNIIVVKVVNGEYLNFVGTASYDTNNDTDIHYLSKLRFYSPVDFEKDKYVKIPLEEDKYVFVAIAAVNSRMNVQSSWGSGLIIDTHSLKNELDINFKDYYDSNVKNIGDTLFEMTSMITAPITELTNDDFKKYTSAKPELNTDIIKVMQINKHLNNSDTVKNIRDAYNQKKLAQTQLSEVQTKINIINEQLSSISFDDVTGTRSLYTAQLTKLNEQKNELLKTINNAIDSISLSVNSAEIPIENAKYRIRGFYMPNFDDEINSHIIGIQLQYRYKNTSSEIGNATSLSGLDGKTYIYSDWNLMNSFNKSKIANFENGSFRYDYEVSNEDKNEPSYNQIDIPISQGESVDIRIKVVYDFGQPYIKMTSDWSDILNIEFPDEFTKDVPVLTIIEENNNDIETNRFENILVNKGINNHIDDMIVDQTTTYYHKPDSIASGFYTAERRVIPLKDKLLSMSNDIAAIKNDITGANGICRVSLAIGENDTMIYSDRENTITLEAYNNFVVTNGDIDGNYVLNDGVISTIINIVISNTGSTALKLYSLFPGNRDILINDTITKAYNKDNYSLNKIENDIKNKFGILYKYQNQTEDKLYQTQNQFVTFRRNDAWTGIDYYDLGSCKTKDNLQSLESIEVVNVNDGLAMVLYPLISTKYSLCIDSNDNHSFITINPGEELVVPMYCEFVASESNKTIKKTISFDLRTSLYDDPANYSFTVVAKNTSSEQDKLTSINKRRLFDRLINPIKYNTTVK